MLQSDSAQIRTTVRDVRVCQGCIASAVASFKITSLQLVQCGMWLQMQHLQGWLNVAMIAYVAMGICSWLAFAADYASHTTAYTTNMHVILQACLKWDPQERLTPEEALQHPWTQSMEPALPAPQPLPTPAALGWTPRNLNPSSTWLSVHFLSKLTLSQLMLP